MGPNVLLTVRGRKTGQPRTFPVAILKTDGREYLFSAFGEVSWVHNLRAAGTATIGHGRRTRTVTATELAPPEAAEVLEAGLRPIMRVPLIGKMIAGWYGIGRHSTQNDYLVAAGRHPGVRAREGLLAAGSIGLADRRAISGAVSRGRGVAILRAVPLFTARISETVAPSRLGRSFRWLLASSFISNVGDGIACAGPLLVASLTTIRSSSRWRCWRSTSRTCCSACLAGAIADRTIAAECRRGEHGAGGRPRRARRHDGRAARSASPSSCSTLFILGTAEIFADAAAAAWSRVSSPARTSGSRTPG